MKIAFLNLCHCDPEIVSRTAKKLTKNKDFQMFIHVDKKSKITPFFKDLDGDENIHFLKDRKKIYWGGFNAIEATVLLLEKALRSSEEFEYFVLLQNLDYPFWSNKRINEFFESNRGTEYIRGCNIANSKDKHYQKKYRIYNKRDDDFYLKKHNKGRMLLKYSHMLIKSLPYIRDNGVIKTEDKEYNIHYGAAQWAVTRECAKYFVEFFYKNQDFNERMKTIQFPDEEYFHTIVHNSQFKYKCIKYDEPEKRWLVNWRNLHYFEFPNSVTVFEEKDYEKIKQEDAMFIRKVRTGISDELLDMIDKEGE